METPNIITVAPVEQTVSSNDVRSKTPGRKSGKTPKASPALKPVRKTSAANAAEALEPLALDASGAAVVVEPLLDPNEDRHVIFPIRHPDLWSKYKQHMAVFWTPEEIDLSRDMKDWERLNDNERHFIKHILGFFAGSDGIVMENLSMRFTREVQWPEAKFFYSCQNLLEAVHSETYSLLIDTYITDPQDKSDVLRAIKTIPCVEKKAKWALVRCHTK